MPKEVKHRLQQTLDRLALGQPTTNTELQYFIDKLTPTMETLEVLGQKYYLAYKELRHEIMQMHTFLNERQEKGVEYMEIGDKIVPIKTIQ